MEFREFVYPFSWFLSSQYIFALGDQNEKGIEKS